MTYDAAKSPKILFKVNAKIKKKLFGNDSSEAIKSFF